MWAWIVHEFDAFPWKLRLVQQRRGIPSSGLWRSLSSRLRIVSAAKESAVGWLSALARAALRARSRLACGIIAYECRKPGRKLAACVFSGSSAWIQDWVGHGEAAFQQGVGVQ